MEITTRMEFDSGHRIPNHKSVCRNLHGHRYAIEVTVKGEIGEQSDESDFGMVIDFSDLKKIVKEEIVDVFDHATVFNKNTPHVELAKELSDRGHSVLLVDYQPTSEMMVLSLIHI